MSTRKVSAHAARIASRMAGLAMRQPATRGREGGVCATTFRSCQTHKARPPMNIRRISHIRNYRVFSNFNWPRDLPDFARFNLIYGWNGSGKTTLSTLFRHLQTKQAIGGGEVQFLVDNNVVDGNAIVSAVLPQVRVFNRDAIKRSIFEVPNEQLPAVYFLGEHSADKQKQIEVLKKDAENAAKEQLSREGKKG